MFSFRSVLIFGNGIEKIFDRGNKIRGLSDQSKAEEGPKRQREKSQMCPV